MHSASKPGRSGYPHSVVVAQGWGSGGGVGELPFRWITGMARCHPPVQQPAPGEHTAIAEHQALLTDRAPGVGEEADDWWDDVPLSTTPLGGRWSPPGWSST